MRNELRRMTFLIPHFSFLIPHSSFKYTFAYST